MVASLLSGLPAEDSVWYLQREGVTECRGSSGTYLQGGGDGMRGEVWYLLKGRGAVCRTRCQDAGRQGVRPTHLYTLSSMLPPSRSYTMAS